MIAPSELPKSAVSNIDFDKLIMIWVKWFIEKNHTKLDWMDYYGKKAEEYKTKRGIFFNKVENPDMARVLEKKLTLKMLEKENIQTVGSSAEISSNENQQAVNGNAETSQNVNPGNRILKIFEEDKGSDKVKKFSYVIEEHVIKEERQDITFSLGLEISGEFLGVGAKVFGNAGSSNGKSESTNNGEKITTDIEVPSNHVAILEGIVQRVSYVQPVKISGHVVLCLSKKKNPGLPYTKDPKKYTTWAVSISQIFHDIKNHKADMKNLDEIIDGSILEKIIFDKDGEDSITFKMNFIQEEVKTVQLTTRFKHEVDQHTNRQIDALRLKVQNNNLNIKIERLFGGKLPVEHCTDLTLREDSNLPKYINTSDILSGIKPGQKFHGMIYGRPGVGKTTLLHMLTRKISEEISKAPPQQPSKYPFKWILQIPLMSLNDKKYFNEKDLEKCIQNIVTDECFREEDFPEIKSLKCINISGEISLWHKKLGQMLKSGEILLICDGFDEMYHKDNERLNSLLKILFTLPYVLVTSRDYNLTVPLDKGTFDKIVLVEGFSPTQIKGYIDYNLSTKKVPEKYADKVIEVLDKKNILSECKVPFMLEAACHMLIGDGDHVDESRMDRIKEDFYGQLLACLCRRYLVKFTSIQERINKDKGEKYDPALIIQERVFELCTFELGFLEQFAFALINAGKETLGISSSVKYLHSNCGADRQTINFLQSIPKVQLDFGLLMTTEKFNNILGDVFVGFNHILFKKYFAARFVASLLQNQYNPNRKNKVSLYQHSWANISWNEERTLEEYIKERNDSIDHKPIWDTVREILTAQEDHITLKMFNDLLETINIKQDTLTPLKLELEALPAGYAFNLYRVSPTKLAIECTKFGIKKNNILIGLHTILKVFIEQNHLDKLNKPAKHEINDENDKVIIICDNPKVITAIAINLRLAAGKLLEKAPVNHNFFTGHTGQRSGGEEASDKAEYERNSIICPIQ